MQNGRNPTRRNRNIGTPKSGHGRDNRLVIPSSGGDPRVFWQRLTEPITFELNGFAFFVEACSEGFRYMVTIDDLVRMLALLPREDVASIRSIVLRQPTQKQRVLSNVWGRLAYFADFGRSRGPAIVLDALRPDDRIEYPTSLTPEDTDELDRLRADGHTVTLDARRRSWLVETSAASGRTTQLFRTVPHEVGHHVHYRRDVLEASKGDPSEIDRVQQLYFAKPQREREAFAHRYADEFANTMAAEKRVPFAPIVDRSRITRMGLDPNWFAFA